MMLTFTTIAQWAVRVTGPLLVALGILFWTGRALTLLPLHMLIGAIFVLALLSLAGLAGWAGLNRVLVLLSLLWGVSIPFFGIAQTRLLPGPAHWVVRASHLLIGIVGMVIAARLGRFIRGNPGRSSRRRSSGEGRVRAAATMHKPPELPRSARPSRFYRSSP